MVDISKGHVKCIYTQEIYYYRTVYSAEQVVLHANNMPATSWLNLQVSNPVAESHVTQNTRNGYKEHHFAIIIANGSDDLPHQH